MKTIIVAFESESTRNRIIEILDSNSSLPKRLCRTGKEAIRNVRMLGGGIVICPYKLSDMTADDLAFYIQDIGAVIVIAPTGMFELCGNKSIYKLNTPLKKGSLISAVEELLKVDSQKTPHEKGKKSEEEIKAIDEAKGILMGKYNMSEPEAHHFLQKKSMGLGFKLITTARFVIKSNG